MPLLLQLDSVNAAIFWFDAVNAAIFPVKRRWLRFFSGSTPLMPLLFWLNAVNSVIFPVKRR